MKQAIVIASTPTYNPYLSNLLQSLNKFDKYPIISVFNYNYELGKIKWMYEHTDIDEFFLLQETCEIKDTKLFDILFEDYANQSVAIGARYTSYLCKYTREGLSKLEIPDVESKYGAVDYEYKWNHEYAQKNNMPILFPDFWDTNNFIDKFDRKVMVLENDYLIKYKSCWNPSMISQNEKMY